METQRSTLRVFLATAVGAFVGTVIALQMYRMLWWVGMIGGGLIAYIGYAPFEAAKTFWRILTAKAFALFGRAIKNVWSSPSGACWLFGGVLVFVSDIVLLFCVPLSLASLWPGYQAGVVNPTPDLNLIWVLGGIVWIGWSSFITLVSLNTEPDTFKNNIRDARSTVLQWNPLVVMFCVLPNVLWKYVLRHIPRLLLYAVVYILVRSVVAVEEFLREVHSDLRLLCGVDAAIGTAIGYAFGNALLGAIIGGTFGVVNYKVVRLWVVKAAPAS